ncbi:MAG: HIT family protein [Halothiobacillaceae bacterium]|nr:HIT family protein [Halothiobacillaceae bacterium]HER35284.1 HIT family protein [Halothiobacillaceae bacterium]
MNPSIHPDAEWRLHPRLTADSVPILNRDGIQYRLIDDHRFPWLLVVPMLAGAEQLHDLPSAWRDQSMRALQAASRTLEALYVPHRINIGAIGNLVPQLHLHCVARFHDDAAWPGVVWGAGTRTPMAPLTRLARVQAIGAGLVERLATNSTS